MLKRILLSIVLLLVIAYLVVAITAFNRKPAGQVCRDMELVIKDTVYAGFITKKDGDALADFHTEYSTGSTYSTPLRRSADVWRVPVPMFCYECDP